MPHLRWLVVLLGVAVALPVSIGSAGAATRAVATGDQTILTTGVITAADVPATWTAAKQGPESSKSFQGITACKQISAAASAARKGPHKQSRQFSDPSDHGNTYAENTVYAFKNAAAATKYLVPFQASTFATCLQKSLQKQLGSLDQVSAGQPVSNLQGVGDAAVGYEFQIQANVQGAQMTYIYDAIGVRIGRAFVGFTFTNPNVQIPQGPDIVNAVISRVQHAAGG
jgi:hypothetical protein